MARFGLNIRLPTQAQPFLPVATGGGAAEVRFVVGKFLISQRIRKMPPSQSTNDDTSRG